MDSLAEAMENILNSRSSTSAPTTAMATTNSESITNKTRDNNILAEPVGSSIIVNKTWLKTNPFTDMVEDLQRTSQMERHRDIEREAALFRNSPEYHTKRAEGTLPAYDTELDAVHDKINYIE